MKTMLSASVNSNSLNLWLLIFRVAIGIFMLTHGIPKVEKLMSGDTQFADPFGIGAAPSLALVAFAEAGCSILLILGLATRLVIIPLIITMLVAVFYAHASDPFGKKELAVLYLTIFTGFLITGPGKYSIDYLLNKKRRG